MSISHEIYQRYLEPGFIPFDPLELAKETEMIVCRDDRRKYTKFICTRMYGGIVTGYTCGCCLRCIFCWRRDVELRPQYLLDDSHQPTRSAPSRRQMLPKQLHFL